MHVLSQTSWRLGMKLFVPVTSLLWLLDTWRLPSPVVAMHGCIFGSTDTFFALALTLLTCTPPGTFTALLFPY